MPAFLCSLCVDNLTYLTSIVSPQLGEEEDIKGPLRKARHAFNIQKPIWKSAMFSNRNTLRLFNSSAKAVVSYGCEWHTRLPAERVAEPVVRQNQTPRPVGTSQARLQHTVNGQWRWTGHALNKSPHSSPDMPWSGAHTERGESCDQWTLGDVRSRKQ